MSPNGKQNSFASRAYASYVLAEMCSQQPRSLSAAYLKAIDSRSSDDFATDAISALEEQQKAFDDVYGRCSDCDYKLNVNAKQGSMDKLLAFVSE